MLARHSPRTRTAATALIGLATFSALAMFSASCSDTDDPTAPPNLAGRPTPTGDPTVSSVVPDSSVRGVTLDITVNGSGFDNGSAVKLERQGVPASGITTNTTTFITSRKLIANITIAAQADTGKYDVAVTTSTGRKGVGIELFTVTYVIDELGIIGGTWSRAHAINDQGEVVGASCTQSCLATAFYWSDPGGQVDLGGLPGYSRSGAFAINNRGQVFGAVDCFPADPGCGPVRQTALVRWDRVGVGWAITPVAGCSVETPFAEGSEKVPINNNEQCVKPGPSGTLRLQTLSGGSVVNEVALPSPYSSGIGAHGFAVSDAPMVAGDASDGTNPRIPVVWYRNAAGAWTTLRLAFPGSDNSGLATDISEPDAAGQVRVSGFTENTNASRAQQAFHAVRWTLESGGAGGWHVASTEILDTGGKGSTNAWARAVNNNGDVVGNTASVVSGDPVKWLATGGMELLPELRAGASGRAVDINSQGSIVGAVWDQGNQCDRAAIWRLR